MTCVLKLLEPDSASVICCNVQLADYAGIFILPSHTPPRSCGFALRVGSPWDASIRPHVSRRTILLVRQYLISHVSSASCYPARRATAFRVAVWALRFGPLIGLEIQAKHADHTLQPPINPLYQRTAVSQPPVPSSLPSLPPSCAFLFSMPLDITFAVCATRQDVVNAVNILRESPYVVLDCEGVGNYLAT